jgi:diguanylate cyclase (GGDEF)-like protein
MGREESDQGSLREEIERLRAALHEAEREATVDAMTACLNRRGWTRSLEHEERRCRRHGLDAVVVVVDLDGLKAINDTRGHAAGDRSLMRCADAIRTAVRGEDLVARLGGDEFGVLTVQTAPEAPEAVIAQIERAFVAARVSASLGWALRSTAGSLAQAEKEADRRMLEAKRRATGPLTGQRRRRALG